MKLKKQIEAEKGLHPTTKKKCCGATMHHEGVTIKNGMETTRHKCYRCGQSDTIGKELKK
jgi:hypothetical protein